MQQLVSIANGNSATEGDFEWLFAYDGNGNLTEVTDPEGFRTAKAYNGDGTLAAITDPRGVATPLDPDDFATRFVSYDANGLPTEIQRRYRDSTDGLVKLQTTRFAYDVDGLLRSIQDPLHASDSGPNERAYKIVFEYDGFHRLGRQSAPKSTRFQPGELIWSSVEYDPNDNVLAEFAPSYDGARAGPRTSFDYDAMDRQTLVTEPDTSADPAGERTQFEYDSAGRLKRVTLPKGVPTPAADDFVVQYEYDPLDRVVTEARLAGDGSALRTHFCFDAPGDLRWVRRPKAGLASAPTGCATGGTPPGFTTRYGYDDAHRLLTETDPLGHARSLAYDPNGDVTSVTDEDGTKQTRTYDERGDLVRVVQPFQKDADGTVTRSLTTKLEYDPVGNLVREISPRAWDAAPAEKTTFLDYVTEYGYDELDRLVQVKLPKRGLETQALVHRGYDPNGNLTMVSLPVAKTNPAELTGAEKTAVQHFDPGWIREIDEPASPKRRFDYRAEGWQTSRIPFNPKPEVNDWDDGQRIAWSYYADGLLRSVTDRGGTAPTVYSYDPNDNLLKADERRNRGRPNAKPIDVEATWDAFDRLGKVRHQDPGTSEWTFARYAYDANGNVVEREQNGREQPNGTPIAGGRIQQFSYDGADWLQTQLDLGKGSGPDDDRRITNVFTPTGWEELRKVERRDAGGQFTVLKQQTEWTWFANGKLRTLETENGAGTVLERHTVSYVDSDGVYVNGHRTRDVFRLQGPNASAPCRSADCTTTYVYDARERVTSETRTRGGSTSTIAYQLDLAGNVERKTQPDGTVWEFAYAANRLDRLTLTKPGGAPAQVQKYWYDLDGNVDCITTETGAPETDCNTPQGGVVSPKLYADYAYDFVSRLVGVKTYRTDGSVSTPDKDTSYDHDALDRPILESEKHGAQDARETTFDYLGLSTQLAQETHRVNGAVTAEKDYVYDAYGNRLFLADQRDGTTRTYSYAHDVHGSVSLLLKDAGDAQASYGYDAYGNEDPELTEERRPDSDQRTDPTDPLNPYRYTGKRLDSGSATGTGGNLLDMGARRFGPDVSHFLQADLFHEALADLDLSADPLTGNRYALAAGNPLSFVETDGHRLDPSAGRKCGEDATPRTWGALYTKLEPEDRGTKFPELEPLRSCVCATPVRTLGGFLRWAPNSRPTAGGRRRRRLLERTRSCDT